MNKSINLFYESFSKWLRDARGYKTDDSVSTCLSRVNRLIKLFPELVVLNNYPDINIDKLKAIKYRVSLKESPISNPDCWKNLRSAFNRLVEFSESRSRYSQVS